MSQQPPQQRPPRPQPPQQGYPQQQGQNPPQGYQQQVPPQQGQYPPQQAYPPQYQQAPSQAPRGNNPILVFFKWVLWPFVKVGGWILSLLNVIIQEILRSTVRLIFGIVLFGLFIALTVSYVIALTQTNFDFAAAVPTMIENIKGLFGL